MKTEHYPSLELCKKLTEIGFPETENYLIANNPYKRPDEIIEANQAKFIRGVSDLKPDIYICPSVMEMLDVMPKTLKHDYELEISYNMEMVVYIYYMHDNEIYKGINLYNLPNALAEMILWLHENKYITF